jgi:hypothetical protein
MAQNSRMVWLKEKAPLNSDEVIAFDAQTRSDLRALLVAALAGGVLAFVVAMMMMAALSMTTPA